MWRCEKRASVPYVPVRRRREFVLVTFIAAAAACARTPHQRIDIAVPISNARVVQEAPSTFVCDDEYFFLTFIDHHNIRELLGESGQRYGISGDVWGIDCIDRYRIPAGSHEFVFWYRKGRLHSKQGDRLAVQLKPGHDYALCSPVLTYISRGSQEETPWSFDVYYIFVDLTEKESCPQPTPLPDQ